MQVECASREVGGVVSEELDNGGVVLGTAHDCPQYMLWRHESVMRRVCHGARCGIISTRP